ncbi:MAG: cupin domain-containing protein [Geminicoccaceae bacterium]|nr:cupin domain-containing protein [Geminicoccaceae bacterium]MDW8371786.1 cupin domain-containing protein [Geminicoccaceae bacterium]
MAEPPFATRSLPEAADTLAPDGSQIRILPQLARGSMVHARLPPGAVAKAVRHRTVEELWYVIAGQGEMWRKQGEREEIVALQPGVALSIPVGTTFQFRNTGTTPLDVVLVTMPPWPGAEEAIAERGPWEPS